MLAFAALATAGAAQAADCVPTATGCFEVADGDQLAGEGQLDWSNVTGAEVAPGGTFLAGEEASPDSWVLGASTLVTPAKSDLTAAWLRLDGSVLLAALARSKGTGTAFAGLELNQRAPGYRESGGFAVPTRTADDRLLSLALGPHGLEANLCGWQGDEHTGAWMPLDPAAVTADGCSPAGVPAGADEALEFAEAAIDLATTGTPPLCHAWFHTRTSQDMGSSPREFTGVTALPAAPGCTPVAAALPTVVRGLGRPEAGRTVNVFPVRGRVKVRRGGRTVALERGAQIPVGSLVDASEGEVRLVSARGTAGGTQSGIFSEGAFTVKQRRGRRVITELVLDGSAGSARAAAKGKKPRLFGQAKGRFRTRGKHAAATVRGTRWLVEDRPSGTYVKVLEGVVSVHDYVRPWTVLVRAGESYLARKAAPKPKPKPRSKRRGR